MMLRKALLAATVLALPVAAHAQPVTGLYVGAGIGGNYLMDTNVRLRTPTIAGTGKIMSKGGIVGVASVGYGLGNGFRIELEGNGRAEHVRFKKPTLGGGDVNTYGAMINALYDFNLGAPVVPYIGVGGGYEFTQLNSFSVYAPGGNPTFAAKSGDLGNPAAQAILGVAYNVPNVPGLAVTAEYRFLATLQSRNFGGVLTANGVRSGGNLRVNNLYNNSLLVGMRYNFGVGPAAVVQTVVPSQPPSVAPSRSYLVFFDWDKSDLTARAQQIIAEAAQNSTRVQATRIDVAGHADRTGTAGYNQALSLRRANNVAAELVRLGVPRSAISIMAFGDTKPLVPTAAGVREPQNRRVEIVLR